MPIYTYRCELCGESFDKRQSFQDAALTTHETDGGSLRKVIHPAGIVFKGSGFYNTDYKNGGTQAEAKGDSDSASETAAPTPAGSSSESKGDSSTGDAAAKGDSSNKSDSSSGDSGSKSASQSGNSGGSTGSSSATPAASGSSN